MSATSRYLILLNPANNTSASSKAMSNHSAEVLIFRLISQETRSNDFSSTNYLADKQLLLVIVHGIDDKHGAPTIRPSRRSTETRERWSKEANMI